MRKFHPKNERIKRKYSIWKRDADRKSEQTVDDALAAISMFEATTNYKDFAAFHIEQARAFKRYLYEAINPKTSKPLSIATNKTRLEAVKAFFKWLADQPGYKSRIRYADCEYFNMSENDARIALARRERPSAEIDQVHEALEAMPTATLIEKRDKAVFALALLTGARDDALASLSLRHFDLAARVLHQDARQVRTKFRKTFSTWFLPVGGKAEAFMTEWVRILREDLRYGADDPLFPKTEIGLDKFGKFAAIGLKREHWKNADAIRHIFKQAYANAGLPAYHPHSIRNTLTRLGEKCCRTPEEFKAWSQNLGHEDVMTTFRSYGEVSPRRQSEIILGMTQMPQTADPRTSEERIADLVLERLSRSKNS